MHIFAGTAERQEAFFSQVNNKTILHNFSEIQVSFSYNLIKKNKAAQTLKKGKMQLIYLLHCK